MPTIAANLRLEPADAVAYFRSKGMEISWDWHELQRDAHARSFTVAKATSLDVLRTIRDMMDKSISSGMTFQDFQKSLRPQLQDLGWWGQQEVLDGDTGELTKVQLGSTRRLRTIYQTNVQTANMAGRYKRMLDNVDNQPYWRYVAVMDGRTRPAHRALHGKVWRWDDPIWQVIFPPNGWGCRCRVQALSEEEFKRLGVPLEDGSKAVDTIQVPVNKAGDTMDVRVVRFTDETGREQIFRPDPGWDYNPGADYASEQALSRVLADKVDKADPETAAAVAATISASPQAQQLLDGAWQSWADDVLDDPGAQNRQMLTGFVRPEDIAALAERDLDVSNVAIVADDTAIAGGKSDSPVWASDSPSPADWIGLSASLREPQAVLLDKADGSLLYVLPGTGDEAQRMVVAVDYGASRSKALAANLRWAYLTLLRDLADAAGGNGFELLGGSLD